MLQFKIVVETERERWKPIILSISVMYIFNYNNQ